MCCSIAKEAIECGIAPSLALDCGIAEEEAMDFGIPSSTMYGGIASLAMYYRRGGDGLRHRLK